MRVKSYSLEKKKRREAFWCLFPWIIGTILFFAYPFIDTVRLSLSDLVNIQGLKGEWNNFSHFHKMFREDLHVIPLYSESFARVLTDAPLIILFALLSAILLNRNIKAKGFFRAVFVLPFILGSGYVLEFLLGGALYEKEESITKGLYIPREALQYLGAGVAHLVQNFLTKISVVMWKSGVQIVIFLGGLQAVPASLYESARIDSANEWQMFWKITLPMIVPHILLNIIYTLVDLFTMSSNPVIAEVLNIGVFERQYDYYAAIGICYLMLIFVLLVIVFGITRLFERRIEE